MPYIGTPELLAAAQSDLLAPNEVILPLARKLRRFNFSKQAEKEAARAAVENIEEKVLTALSIFWPNRFPPGSSYVQWTDKVIQNRLDMIYSTLSYDEPKLVRQAQKDPNVKSTNDLDTLTFNSAQDANRAYYKACAALVTRLTDTDASTDQRRWESAFSLKWVEKDFSAVVLTDGNYQAVEAASTKLYADTQAYDAIASPTDAQNKAYLQSFVQQADVLFHPVDSAPAPATWPLQHLCSANGFISTLRKICKALVAHKETISMVMQFVGEVAGYAALALAAPAPSAGTATLCDVRASTDANLVADSVLNALEHRFDLFDARFEDLHKRLCTVEDHVVLPTD